MKADIVYSSVSSTQQKGERFFSDGSSFHQNGLAVLRRRLRAFTIVGMIFGTLVLLYSVWIIGEAFLETGTTRADIFSFGLLYAWAIVIPIELIISFALYRQLRVFRNQRTLYGIHNRETIEKIAILSIILCFVPFIVASTVFLLAIVFTFIYNIHS